MWNCGCKSDVGIIVEIAATERSLQSKRCCEILVFAIPTYYTILYNVPPPNDTGEDQKYAILTNYHLRPVPYLAIPYEMSNPSGRFNGFEWSIVPHRMKPLDRDERTKNITLNVPPLHTSQHDHHVCAPPAPHLPLGDNERPWVSVGASYAPINDIGDLGQFLPAITLP